VFAMTSEQLAAPSAGRGPVLDIVGAQLRQQQTSRASRQLNPLHLVWSRGSRIGGVRCRSFGDFAAEIGEKRGGPPWQSRSWRSHSSDVKI
jgi:hypothetical protein